MICVFKCTACGDKMVYDNELHKLVCHTCNTTLDIEEYDYSYLSYDNSEIISDELTGCSCPSCGSKIIVGRVETNVSCAYCGAKMAAYGLGKDEISPERIIPFSLSYNEAFGKVLSWWDSKKTMPKFDPDKLSFTLSELYVPVWLFNASVYTCMEAEVSPFDNTIEEVTSESEINRIRKGIKSDYFLVPVDGSARINDTHFHGVEPYDYGDMVMFNPGFLSGHNAERYYHSQYEIVPELIMKLQKFGVEQCKQYIAADRLGGPILESDVIDLEVYPKEVLYALVPMWIATYKYRGKSYQIFINGQTGKVDGDVIFADHRFEREIGIRSISSLFCFGMVGIALIALVAPVDYISKKADSFGRGFEGLLLYVIALLMAVYKTFKEGEKSTTASGKRNLTIKVNDDIQYKQGKKYSFWPGTIFRIVLGVVEAIILILNGSFKMLHIATGTSIFIGCAVAISVAVFDVILFAIKRKKFIVRRDLVDYFEYIKAAGVMEEETIVLR